MATSALASRRLRRCRSLSLAASTLPSARLCPFAVATGVVRLASRTPCPSSSRDSAAPSASASSRRPAVPALLRRQRRRRFCRWRVFRTATPRRRATRRPRATSPAPPSTPSRTRTASSPPICGRRPSSRRRPTRSTPSTSPRRTPSSVVARRCSPPTSRRCRTNKRHVAGEAPSPTVRSAAELGAHAAPTVCSHSASEGRWAGGGMRPYARKSW
mmetsp:Transcript_13986/g.36106  ORF Transcript_13986/g.36106 Transcript_13986/m.36106 type:complete len:215 (+) Transcript_13986:443-1087(+)